MFVLLVQNSEPLTGDCCVGHKMQSSFSHQRAASLAVADEINHVDAAFVEFREFEPTLHAAKWCFVVFDCLFSTGYQAIKIDVSVHFAAGVSIEVGRVDFKDLHNQRRHILHKHIQRDGIVGCEVFLIRSCEIDINPIAQLAMRFGRQQREPFLRVANAVHDLRFSEHVLQPCVVEVRFELTSRIRAN